MAYASTPTTTSSSETPLDTPSATTPATPAKAKLKPKPRTYEEWIKEIDLAEKEQDKFLRQGRRVVRRFIDERDGADAMERRFNIFSANVQILAAALYSKLPKASVSRRFGQDQDDPARVASLIIQNCLMQDMDDPRCDFNESLKQSIQDWLIPGWGQCWLRLESETTTLTAPAVTSPSDPTTTLVPAFEYEQVTDQQVVIEHVFWEDFLVSPCRTYDERRWVGRRVYMTREQLRARFPDCAEDVTLDYKPDRNADTNQPTNLAQNQAQIYEIWDRTTRTVVWVSRGYNRLLDSQADPLKLEGFDPCPRPLLATHSTSSLMPKSDYVMIQDQYIELDSINNRISLLVEAIRAAGLYDEAQKGVQALVDGTSVNKLVPVSNWAMFAEKGGIKGVIDWMPLDAIVAALERLRIAREDIKAQIYELTGISDIVRGSTKASETLGAQQLKAQFANIRVQDRQDMVARFVEEILQIKAEILCRHFVPEMLLKMSNMQYYYDSGNRQLIQAAIDLIQAPHDEFEWRVSVQADSLAQLDYSQQRQEKVEFTNAVATYLQSASSIIQNAPMFAPIVLETLKFVVSGFRGSQELEGVVDQTLMQVKQQLSQPKPPPPPPPQVIAAQAQLQAKQQESQLRLREKAAEMQMKTQEHQQEMVQRSQLHQQEVAQKSQAHDQQIEQQNQKALFNMMAKIAEQATKDAKEKE